jgi:excisionase family DNA binding protein
VAQRETLAFSRREAADSLGLSLRGIDYLLAQGRLCGRRIGRRVLIPRSELDRLLCPDKTRAVGRQKESEDK